MLSSPFLEVISYDFLSLSSSLILRRPACYSFNGTHSLSGHREGILKVIIRLKTKKFNGVPLHQICILVLGTTISSIASTYYRD